jgi:hypothetical protein
MRIYDSYGNLINTDVLGEVVNLNMLKYRMDITINNSSNSSSLTDYQVLITLDTASLISAGKMRSDCGDIRFYDGTNLLSYWIESGINTASTKIWVKVPSIPANLTKIIQMYYGNMNLTSISNANDTFLFFDDFSGNLDWTNKWQSTQQSLYTVASGILTLNYLTDTTKLLQTKNSYTNFEIRTAIKEGVRQVYLDLSTSVATYTGKDMVIYGTSTDNTLLRFFANGTQLGSATISTNTWYYIRSMFDGTTVRHIAYTDPNWSNVLLDLSGTAYSDAPRYPSFFVYYYNSLSIGYVDFVYIKKYSNPEPTTSVGNEYIVPIRIRIR